MLNLGLNLSNFGNGLKIGLFSQIHKQNKLDEKIKAATSFFLLLASLLKMGCVYANSTYKIHNPNGIRLLTWVHHDLNHLNKHKFRHNFADCVNSLCSYSIIIYCNIKDYNIVTCVLVGFVRTLELIFSIQIYCPIDNDTMGLVEFTTHFK